jgi:protein-disulfide isomerase
MSLTVRRPLRSLTAASLLLAIAACDSSAPSNAATAEQKSAAKAGATAQTRDWTQVVTATPEGGFLMGNPNAPVKLIEFASLQCSACANFHETAYQDLKNNYVKPGNVSYEVRTFILGPIDVPVTLAARCQGAQTFFPVADGIFKTQGEWLQRAMDNQARLQALQSLPQAQQLVGILEATGLDQYFRARGLPTARLQQCMADQKQIELLGKIRSDGVNQYGLTGTPTFVINGETVEGVSTWADLEPKIQAAL